MKIITTGVLLIKALRIRTSIKQKIITTFGLSGNNLVNEDNTLSRALVWTTPWPRINKHNTVIKDVLLKPFRIVWGLSRFLSSWSKYGNIEKKMSKKVRITIDFSTIDRLSNA